MLQEREGKSFTVSTEIKTVLLIEKNETNLQLHTEQLIRNGYYATATSNHAEASIYILGETKPDLVIAEVDSISKSGLDILESLKNDHGIPYALIGNQNDTNALQLSIEIGAINFISLPFTELQFIGFVEYSIKLSKDQEKLLKEQLNLQENLEFERCINVAVGITMVKHQLNQVDSFNLLRRNSRDKRLKLGIMCSEIVNAINALNTNLPDIYHCEQKLTCKFK